MLIETAAIRTVWGTAWHFLKSVPREIWYIAAAALLLVWIDGRAYDRGYSEREAIAQEQARQAQERANEAAQDASETVTETRNEVEQGNAQAREAANGSDDPLRDGLNSLR